MRVASLRLTTAALCVLLAACATAPPPAPPPPPPPHLTVTGTAERVILISFDGLGADELTTFGAPAFQHMPARVTRLVPVSPTATSSAHASIITGATPEQTGVVANQFHKPGTPIDQVAKGLDTDIDVDTLIDIARRNGKRVGSIAFPTVDGRTPRRTPDFGVYWTEKDTAPRIIVLRRTDFHADWLPPAWGKPTTAHPSFSPVMRARIDWDAPSAGHEDVDIAAYDTTDDRVQNYDTFYIETSTGEIPLDAQHWFAVSKRGEGRRYGSWSKILSFEPSLTTMTIYAGGVTHTEAIPASLQQTLDDEIGFWPGPPDEPNARRWLAGNGGLDPDSFAQQNARLSDFITGVTTLLLRREKFDLLLAYEPLVDEAEHVFRIELRGQAHYSDENRAAGERVRRSAFVTFNDSVAALDGAIDPSRDAIVITGDHGLAPADTEVSMNRILVNWGYAMPGDKTVAPDSRWAAYATGNAAMLYRFAPPDDTDELAARLASLRTLDGDPVFEVVRKKTPSSHPNSGDLTLFSFPRFALDGSLGETFTPTVNYGQHGGLSAHHEFHTTLGAYGKGVATETIATLPQTDIAGYVSTLLGMK